MKNLILFLLASLCVLGCSNRKAKQAETEKVLPKDSLVQKYENEYFSIMCPQGWKSEWEEYVPETEDIARVLKEKGLKGGAAELYSPDNRLGIRLVKSVAAWLNPNGSPRQWLEMSALGRQAEGNIIGMSEITDSILIDGYDASEITFATLANINDTLMVDQYAIVPSKNELYYASIKYFKGDEEAYYILWKMLHTLHLKVKE